MILQVSYILNAKELNYSFTTTEKEQRGAKVSYSYVLLCALNSFPLVYLIYQLQRAPSEFQMEFTCFLAYIPLFPAAMEWNLYNLYELFKRSASWGV